ncbi:MAG: hypothetical protein CMH63_03230 [Nanoarchaeota archaeon]|jgi:ubiquinone/menaquinone biosynthesis C-methylase UbiE|nr:hypothetical protein [Nanoarchaeota archaeon]|tara:strand:+ start:7915 stop:8496 length:582 start_codon:yes stop_codon:yes gene_type:complete
MSEQKTWDKIAESWSNFRQKYESKLNDLPWTPGKILDLGCGNCRNLIPFKKFTCYGLDLSTEMLKQAKIFTKKHNLKVKLIQGNLTKTPYKDNFFNYVLALATLHHLKNPEKGIKEIYRILTPGGQAYITTWNKLQPKFLFKSRETYIRWGKEKRYYNLISFIQLRKLLKQQGFTILQSKMFGKNLEFLVTKP